LLVEIKLKDAEAATTEALVNLATSDGRGVASTAAIAANRSVAVERRDSPHEFWTLEFIKGDETSPTRDHRTALLFQDSDATVEFRAA